MTMRSANGWTVVLERSILPYGAGMRRVQWME